MGCCQSCLGKSEVADPLGDVADRRSRGERLGGQPVPDQESAEVRRQRALLAAERRAGGTTPIKSSAPRQRNQRPSRGSDGRDHTHAGSGAPVEGQSDAARAAERREAQGSHSHTGISAEQHRQLAEKRKRDELVGKIEHYAHLAGEDPPFGLRAASIEVLNRHLARTKAAARRKGAGAR